MFSFQVQRYQELFITIVLIVDGDVHTNTIEGFWSLLKRAWYGSHHHYSIAYAPLYVAEACYKYNYRKDCQVFWRFCLKLWDGELHNPKSKTTNCV